MNSTLRVVPMLLLLGACDDRAVTTARPPAQNKLAEAPEGAGMVARRCGKGDAPFFSGTLLESREDWYGRQLRATGESQLCQGGDQAATVYRLTWIPSFHPSVTVRIVAGTNGYVLTAKILSGAGGYEPGSVARDTTITLADADVGDVSQLLTQARFWELPTIPPTDGMIGLDGAQWVLEGLSAGRYHVVDRWTPDPMGPDGSFRRLAEWILARSGLVPSSLVKEY